MPVYFLYTTSYILTLKLSSRILTIVLFAVDLALIVAGGGAIVAGFANMAHGNLLNACFLGGVGAISIGVGILFYFLAKESIKLSFGLSKKLLLMGFAKNKLHILLLLSARLLLMLWFIKILVLLVCQ